MIPDLQYMILSCLILKYIQFNKLEKIWSEKVDF